MEKSGEYKPWTVHGDELGNIQVMGPITRLSIYMSKMEKTRLGVVRRLEEGILIVPIVATAQHVEGMHVVELSLCRCGHVDMSNIPRQTIRIVWDWREAPAPIVYCPRRYTL